MVLELSTSPFAGRAPSSKLSSVTVAANASSSATGASSAPSSIVRLSFLSDMAAGRQQLHHGITKRSSLVNNDNINSNPNHRTRTLSSSGSTLPSKPAEMNKTATAAVNDVWMRNVFRLLGVISMISTLLLVPTYRKPDNTSKNGFGRGTQFLTIMNMLISIVCLSLSIAGDLFKKPNLTRIKNAILPIVVPGECAVTILYWYLTLSDAYNIYTDGDRYIPLWLDLQMHGIPFLIMGVEMFCYSEAFKVRRFAHFCAIAAFAAFYICWSSFCAYMDDGEWPYPVIQKLDCHWKRLYLMLYASAVGVVSHFVISETHIRVQAIRNVKHALKSAGVSA